MYKMIELDNKRSAALLIMVWVKKEFTQTFTNGLSQMQMVQ